MPQGVPPTPKPGKPKEITPPPTVEAQGMVKKTFRSVLETFLKPLSKGTATLVTAYVATEIFLAVADYYFGATSYDRHIRYRQEQIDVIRKRQKAAEKEVGNIPGIGDILKSIPKGERGAGAVLEWLGRPEDLPASVNVLEADLARLKISKEGMKTAQEYLSGYLELLSMSVLFMALLGPISRRIDRLAERLRSSSGDKHIAGKATEADKHNHENLLILQKRIQDLEGRLTELMNSKPPETKAELEEKIAQMELDIAELKAIISEAPEESASES